MDPARREALFIQANDIIINDVAVIPLIHRRFPNGTSNTLEGIDLTPWDSSLWQVQDLGAQGAMTAYLVRRILLVVPVSIVISIVIFAILALAPGDPLSAFATDPSVLLEVRENIRRSLGLDAPIDVR